MLRRTALVLGILFSGLFAAWWILIVVPNLPRDRVTHPTTLGEVISPRVQDAITSADGVEAVLTENVMSIGSLRDALPPDSVIDDYRVRSAPVRLSDAQRRELVALLLDRRSYQNEWPPSDALPDVAYRFVSSRDTLDVLVSLESRALEFIGVDSSVSWGCAIPVGSRLSALTLAVYPGDSAVASAWRDGVRRDSLRRVRPGWKERFFRSRSGS
jgi:hypothetical protein